MKPGSIGWSRRLVLAGAAALASAWLPQPAEARAEPRMPASTPPMGWNPFNAFRLAYDEADVFRAAEALRRLGLAEAGYRYVNIDDGWWLRRTASGIGVRTNLFPSAQVGAGGTSFRPFVDRLHAMGLKAGIYTDIGRNTCGQHWDADSPNLPAGTRDEREVGLFGHEAADARLFAAEWGFDFVKVDACGLADYASTDAQVRAGTYRAFDPLILRDRPARSDGTRVAALYAGFADALRKAAPSRPPILAICAWGEADVNDWAGRHGQMWRTSGDIRPKWSSMLGNFDSAAPRALFAGPGRWNDPDLLEVGNGDFDEAHLIEARAHMSMWAIIAAPLMLSYDLTKATPAINAIAGNRDVIAIDQDPAGHQGVILSRSGDGEIVVKPLSGTGRKAVALINRGNAPLSLTVTLADLHLDPAASVRVRDVWRRAEVPAAAGRITVALCPRETALLTVAGSPATPRTTFADEIPARITVVEDGFKPADRGSRRPWVPARIGHMPDGTPLGDRSALGVAAGSRLRVMLDGKYRAVQVTPAPGTAAGRYAVYGDGRLLGAGRAGGAPARIMAKGVRALDLVAPAGEGTFVWHDVRLER